jgi:putative ABC transport system permease protein
VRRFFRRGRLDDERAREMQTHIDHHVDDLMAAGYPRDRALREARRRFGNPTAIREEIYRMNSVPVLEPVVRDLRYAFRMLRKTPGFTAIALLTLAIGIGVNTAVFTVVHALLLKPLPFPEPARLATLSTLTRSPRGGNENTAVDGRTFFAIRDHATTVDAALQAGSIGEVNMGGGVNLVANGAAANVEQRRVSAGYFSVLGIRPFMGREFTAEEDRKSGPPAAVLSYELWTRAFGSDRNIVGQAITLRGEPYAVVGVMPRGFTTGHRADVWTPLRPSTTGEGGSPNYGLLVRLRPGINWDQANAEVNQVCAPAAQSGFKDDVSVVCALVPLQQRATEGIRRPLLMLWGAVGLVLLIACVNVAGLLLARSGSRTREIATRMALGSGRRAVIRQLLVESGLLALAGGALGIVVGWGALAALMRLSADVFPLGYPVRLDAPVLAMTLFGSLITSVVFGLVPALHASRVDVQSALAASGTRAVAGGQGGWARRVLVAGEVAMGLVLLVGAGLLVRTFVHLSGLSPGFDPSSVTTATISLQDKRYDDPAKVNRLFADTLAGLRRQPGVEAAGVTLGLPFTRLLNWSFGKVEGAATEDKGGMTNVCYVTPGYVEALRLPLRKGRLFTDADQAGSTPVVIVNEEFGRRFYHGEDVVGLHIRLGGTAREIVGIVSTARGTSSGLAGGDSPLIAPYVVYLPATQTNGAMMRMVHTWFSPSWVVRSTGPVAGLPEAIRQSIAAVDPLLPIAKMESMADVRAASLAQQRFMMSVVVGLGAVALLLAAIGIHGLIASSVSERTRELGIRLALGATGRQVVKDVVMPGVVLAGVGVAIGSAASLAAVRLLQSFLWGVTPGDPLTFAVVVITLFAVALIASLIPALRVLRLDPALTLRAE